MTQLSEPKDKRGFNKVALTFFYLHKACEFFKNILEYRLNGTESKTLIQSVLKFIPVQHMIVNDNKPLVLFKIFHLTQVTFTAPGSVCPWFYAA